MKIIEQVQQRFNQLAEGDRRALLIVGIFLTVVFSYVWLMEPLLIRYDNAQSELQELLERQRRFNRQVTMLPRRESRLAEYRTELDALNRRFNIEVASPEAAVSRSISELTYYARLCEINIDSIRPLENQPSGDYIEIPFEVEASGDYNGLRKFFYYIDTSPSLLAITRLSLNGEDSANLRTSLQLADIVRLSESDDIQEAITARENRLQLVVSQWIGYAPLIIAQRNGYLDSERFRIDFVPVNDNVTTERLLLSGEVDGIGTTLPALLNYWVKGVPLTVVMPMSSAAGTEGIVVRQDSAIQSLSDLRQQVVAVDQQGILMFVLFNALNQAEIPLANVNLQPLEAVQVSRDIISGTLEVGLTREPYLSSLLATRQARLLYDSESLQGLILDMLAINPEVAKKKAAAVQFLIDGLLKAQRFIAEQPQRTMEIISDWEGQPLESTQTRFAKVKVFDTKSTRDFFASSYMQELLEVFEGYFQETQQPFPLVTYEDIANASFVNKAVEDSLSDSDQRQ